MTAFLRPFRELCQERGHTIILVHHFRKAGDRARGSSSLEAAVDGWWSFKPGRAVPGGHHPVNAKVTLRDGDDQRFGVKFDVDPTTGIFSMTHRVVRDDDDEGEADAPASPGQGYKKRAPGKRTNLLKAMQGVRDLLIARPEHAWSKSALADELGISRTAGIEAVNAWIAEGMVAEPEKGYTHRWIGPVTP
jgi:hypothetical protein